MTHNEQNLLMQNYPAPIEFCSWGRYVINGKEHSKVDDVKVGVGKDIRVIGTNVSTWKERVGHDLTFDMITGIWEGKIDCLIIGIGHLSAVRCPDDVVAGIRNKGIPEVLLLPTPAACEEYNRRFGAGENVALLAHGTC